MATFTAWKFTDVEGADRAVETLRQVWQEGLVKVDDYAVVQWPAGADKPDVKYETRDEWRATGWGALWGALFGAIFFLPLVGAAAGAVIGLIRKRVEGMGISQEQLDSIGAEVTPGTSALFVVATEGDLDRVAERFRGQHAHLLATNLVGADAEDIRRAFEE